VSRHVVLKFYSAEAVVADMAEEIRRAMRDEKAWLGRTRLTLRLNREIVERFISRQPDMFSPERE
jgi:hypothetical protein